MPIASAASPFSTREPATRATSTTPPRCVTIWRIVLRSLKPEEPRDAQQAHSSPWGAARIGRPTTASPTTSAAPAAITIAADAVDAGELVQSERAGCEQQVLKRVAEAPPDRPAERDGQLKRERRADVERERYADEQRRHEREEPVVKSARPTEQSAAEAQVAYHRATRAVSARASARCSSGGAAAMNRIRPGPPSAAAALPMATSESARPKIP